MRRKGSIPACAARQRARNGYMLFEVQVAFVLLGIGLAGLCPLVVMQLRQVRQLELRMHGQVSLRGVPMVMPAAPTYYLVPWQNQWAQKLAGSAQIVEATHIPCDPGPLQNPSHVNPSYAVTVLTLDAPPCSQSVSAYVDVTATP